MIYTIIFYVNFILLIVYIHIHILPLGEPIKYLVKNSTKLFQIQGHEHDFKQDWGEQLVGKHKLALNILDLNSGDINTLDTIPEDLSVGQVSQ